jgi:hypothetical protein
LTPIVPGVRPHQLKEWDQAFEARSRDRDVPTSPLLVPIKTMPLFDRPGGSALAGLLAKMKLRMTLNQPGLPPPLFPVVA